jgi:hypothetical protein
MDSFRDPAANLNAAISVLLAALTPLHDPCVSFSGQTAKGKDYIIFQPVDRHATDVVIPLLTLEAHGDG